MSIFKKVIPLHIAQLGRQSLRWLSGNPHFMIKVERGTMKKALLTVVAILSLAVASCASNYLDNTVKLPITLHELGLRYLALVVYIIAIITCLITATHIFNNNNNENTTNNIGV